MKEVETKVRIFCMEIVLAFLADLGLVYEKKLDCSFLESIDSQTKPQGRKSASFRSYRDCPSYLASANTVCDLLLPSKTSVREK